MGERRSPLFDEAIANQRALHEQEENRERMKEVLPAFQDLLGAAITTHISPPERIVREVTSFSIQQDFADRVESSRNRRQGDNFDTVLSVTIPHPGGEIVASLSASSYPEGSTGSEDGEAASVDEQRFQKIHYKIDIQSLDTILLIKNGKAIVESKKWESEPFTMNTPIGGESAHSWHENRDATPQDIEDYTTLIESLDQDDVIFTGKTPAIIVNDYAAIQAKIMQENPQLLALSQQISAKDYMGVDEK